MMISLNGTRWYPFNFLDFFITYELNLLYVTNFIA